MKIMLDEKCLLRQEIILKFDLSSTQILEDFDTTQFVIIV